MRIQAIIFDADHKDTDVCIDGQWYSFAPCAHWAFYDYQAAADMPKDLRQEMISEWVRRGMVTKRDDYRSVVRKVLPEGGMVQYACFGKKPARMVEKNQERHGGDSWEWEIDL